MLPGPNLEHGSMGDEPDNWKHCLPFYFLEILGTISRPACWECSVLVGTKDGMSSLRHDGAWPLRALKVRREKSDKKCDKTGL